MRSNQVQHLASSLMINIDFEKKRRFIGVLTSTEAKFTHGLSKVHLNYYTLKDLLECCQAK